MSVSLAPGPGPRKDAGVTADAHPGTTELLRGIPGLASLDEASLRRIAELVGERTVVAGDALIEEGTTGDESFLIVEGEAAITTNGELLARVGPGEFVGELALLTDARRCASVHAASPMRVLVLNKAALASLLDPITEALLGTLARRLTVRGKATTDPVRTGALVAIRSSYAGTWVEGFEVADVDLSGSSPRVQVRRQSDDAILPVSFGVDEIRIL